jgi:hypothetical protein
MAFRKVIVAFALFLGMSAVAQQNDPTAAWKPFLGQ